MAQQPAVVIIARHGMRLDAADSSWHHSTPTPYDPPLTYGGWNQCRALGGRIANILHAREEEALHGSGEQDGNVRGRDFAKLDEKDEDGGRMSEERPKKRRRIKHKVVIHTSPFLRCLQTSVAIAAGMAQYNPKHSDLGVSKKTHGGLHSASPGLHGQDGAHGSPKLSPLPDARSDFAHAIARKALHSHRYRKCKLRVDAFLGEWLNPSYFDSITPPPPSAMMVATAKAELMENETVEIFTSATNAKPNIGNNSLWGSGTAEQNRPSSREGSLDDWNALSDGLPPSPTSPSSPGRSRASTATESGRKSPFRPERTLQPLTSTLPKQETAIYHPPQPHYAISASSQIPRGYVTHARNACCNVDYSWDSSRPPHDWGDGGELGEEWSTLHKRTRRGFNGMIMWYNRHGADERNEDVLGFEQSGQHGDEEIEEQEDLVVILVTHGASCNALIGALTGQPVLLDVGMASLTMAVRRDDAPSLTVLASEHGPDGSEAANGRGYHTARRGSMDMGLSSVYEMKLVSSSSHMHPSGAGIGSPSMRPIDSALDRSGLSRHARRPDDPPRSNTSSALGSIRRPSAMSGATGWMGTSADRSSSMPPNRLQAPSSSGTSGTPSTPGLSPGLWTPPAPASRSPGLSPYMSPALQPLPESKTLGPDGDDVAFDLSNTTDNSRTISSHAEKREVTSAPGQADGAVDQTNTEVDKESKAPANEDEKVAAQPKPTESVRPPITRGLSQKGLWGYQPKGATPERKGRQTPKRRWTVDQD